MTGSSDQNGAHEPSGSGETPSPSGSSAEELGRVPQTVAEAFGEIVWLMSQSPLHKQFLIGDLEWLVMPPVALRQFRMYRHEGRPVAVVLYAFVSEEVERRIEAGAPTMRPADWKSGERAWIVQVIAPFGEAEAFAKEACQTVLKGREVRTKVAEDVMIHR